MEDKDAGKKKRLSKLPDAGHSLNTYEIIWKYVTRITHPNDYLTHLFLMHPFSTP